MPNKKVWTAKAPKEIDLGADVKIGQNVRINVSDYLKLGDRTVINDNVLIEGRHIEIGREAWIDEYAHIGGGSCFDWQSELRVGDFLHMGKFSHINTARKVAIGDECGIGIGTKVFSHGAYLSSYNGFPVKFADIEIGSNVWLPYAWVNPGVKIGNNVVVAAMSLVNDDLPSGCLAGGIPARILQANVYPRGIPENEKTVIIDQISKDLGTSLCFNEDMIQIGSHNSSTVFDLEKKTITGVANEGTEILKNQLRRYGIRFKYYAKNGVYTEW